MSNSASSSSPQPPLPPGGVGASAGRAGGPARPPRRRFGQHFLHDRDVIRRIVAAVAPAPGERVVEIGPGRGALTEPLLASGAELDAIELDRDLVAELRARFADAPRLRVHAADALTFDLSRLGAGERKLRVVGNLPYNVSSPLLFRLLAQLERIEDMHVMLQREVAARILARPGEPAYGRLSAAVQLACVPERLLSVAPGAFHPPPKVQSTVLRLRPRPAPAVALRDRRAFETVLRTVFSQRRKTIRNALKRLLPEAEIRGCRIDPQRRPQTLSLPELAALANALAAREDDVTHSACGQDCE